MNDEMYNNNREVGVNTSFTILILWLSDERFHSVGNDKL